MARADLFVPMRSELDLHPQFRVLIESPMHAPARAMMRAIYAETRYDRNEVFLPMALSRHMAPASSGWHRVLKWDRSVRNHAHPTLVLRPGQGPSSSVSPIALAVDRGE